MSLSCLIVLVEERREGVRGWSWFTYWDLLLGQNYGTVLALDANGHDVGGSDSLECILCALLAMILAIFIPRTQRSRSGTYIELQSPRLVKLTNLVQASLIREDGDVPVVGRTVGHDGVCGIIKDSVVV